MAGLEIGIWKQSGFPGGLICIIMSPFLPAPRKGGWWRLGEPPRAPGRWGERRWQGTALEEPFLLLLSFCAVVCLCVFFFFLYNEVGAYSPCSVGVFPPTAAEQARTAESGPALQTQGFDGSSLILPWESQFSPPMSE